MATHIDMLSPAAASIRNIPDADILKRRIESELKTIRLTPTEKEHNVLLLSVLSGLNITIEDSKTTWQDVTKEHGWTIQFPHPFCPTMDTAILTPKDPSSLLF